MNKLTTKLLLVGFLALLVVRDARAGFNPFVVRVEATATAQPPLSGSATDTKFTAATAPAEIQFTGDSGNASASATFTELKGFAFDNTARSGSQFAEGRTLAADTLTITAPGSPSGTTRLEMTWDVDGTIGDGGSILLAADYSLNTTDNLGDPELDAGFFQFTNSGPFDESLTMVLDDIPIGEPFNVETAFSVVANGFNSTSDFSNSASLTSVVLFIDDIRIPAGVTGASGQVYSVIPEPTSLAILGLGLGGLALTRRRSRIFSGGDSK